MTNKNHLSSFSNRCVRLGSHYTRIGNHCTRISNHQSRLNIIILNKSSFENRNHQSKKKKSDARYLHYTSRFGNHYTRKRNHYSRLSISFYGASDQQLVSGEHFDRKMADQSSPEYLSEFLDSLRSSLERTAAVYHASDLVGIEFYERRLYTCACRFNRHRIPR